MNRFHWFIIMNGIVFSIAGATSISFSNMNIMHRIGMHDPQTHCWTITNNVNDVSNTDMGILTPETQFRLVHHQYEIYIDAGDSILNYDYQYRYYHCGDTLTPWKELDPEYYGQYVHVAGFHYGCWSLDSVKLFRLPLDTGDHCLEFRHRATVTGISGDTLTREYVPPDGQPFRIYFSVKTPLSWGFADSMRSMAVFRQENGRRDTLLLHGGGIPDTGNYFHSCDLGETDEIDPLYLESLVCNTYGDIDACSYFYRFYETACTDTPAFKQIPLSTENGSRWIADDLQLSLCRNRDPGKYVLEIYGCVSHEDSIWSDQFDRPGDSYYTASYDICSSEGGTDPPLPISLSDFSAEPGEGTVELSWSTESETENSHFLIYRNDGVIGRVAGAGTVSEPRHYRFTDKYVESGNVYTYELADVSFGSVEHKHGAVEVELEAEVENAENFILEAAYPNPFNPRTVINLRYETGSRSHVGIYSTQGALVDELINGYVEPGTYEITWDAAGMPSGVYIVRMTAGNVLRSRKIVLLK